MSRRAAEERRRLEGQGPPRHGVGRRRTQAAPGRKETAAAAGLFVKMRGGCGGDAVPAEVSGSERRWRDVRREVVGSGGRSSLSPSAAVGILRGHASGRAGQAEAPRRRHSGETTCQGEASVPQELE